MDHSFELFDRLDSYWKSQSEDDIVKLLDTAISRGEPSDVLVDLCAADLEWRLRTGAASLTATSRRLSNNSPELPRASDYQKLLVHEWNLPTVRKQLLEAEWVARSRFADRPHVDEFANQIPDDKQWRDELSSLLDLIAPMQLLFHDGNEVVQCQVPAKFEIGRAKRNEPAPPAWNAEENRAIVAKAQFRSLSRAQISVRRVRLGEIELINLSSIIPSRLDNSILEPGETISRPLPLTLFFTHFRLEICCTSDIEFSLINAQS
jgi:hypothetical protein